MKAVDRVCLSIGMSEEQLNGGAEWLRTHKDTNIVDTPLWVFISLGCEAIRKGNEEAQPKRTDDSCLDFDFDKVKETLKKDNLGDLIVDHTCKEKSKQMKGEVDGK